MNKHILQLSTTKKIKFFSILFDIYRAENGLDSSLKVKIIIFLKRGKTMKCDTNSIIDLHHASRADKI